MEGMIGLLAIVPLLVFLVLLFGKKVSLLISSMLALIVLSFLVVFVWRVVPVYLWQSVIRAVFMAVDIFLIVGGAVFFLEILKKADVINNFCVYIESISRDYRVQIIMLAWFVEAFIEGTAGFGTPTVIAIPLLVGLGLSPLMAVAVSLFGNSAPVVFGAAGTPIRVGFSGLNTGEIPLYAALINSVGIIVPVFMLWLVTIGRGQDKGDFWDGLPFAVWSGFVFSVFSIVTVFFGQEFPSIIGSLLAMAVVYLTTKMGLFVPKKPQQIVERVDIKTRMSLGKMMFPYLLLIGLLVGGKFVLGSVQFVVWGGIKQSFNLFNPGLMFLLSGLITAFVWKNDFGFITRSLVVSVKKTIEPFVVIIWMSMMVQLMLVSGNNLSGLPSFFELMSLNLSKWLLPVAAPVLGAFGSFITGSATLSNVMFGSFLVQVGEKWSVDTAILLALAVVGGAAGNMVALADMLVASTVAGLKNAEWKIVKIVGLPCLIYVSLVGLIGLVLIK